MPTLEGKWTAPLLSGGAPPAETCINNPQFAIYPSVENATYHIEFARQDLEAKFRGLTDGIISASQTQELIRLCWSVATLPDAGAIPRTAAAAA